MSIHKKYRTRAVKYYRERLDAIERGEAPPQAPGPGEGARVDGLDPHLRVEIQGFGSDDLLPKKPKKRSRSRFKEGWEKGKRKMEKWGKGISRQFNKIFRRSKSKSKKRKPENSTNDDVSASNDSYFELGSIHRRKPANHKRFDDDLISFKKSRKDQPGKPFLGWKNYLEKPSGSKYKASYKQKIRSFKSQTSGGDQQGLGGHVPVDCPGSYSDHEGKMNRKLRGRSVKTKKKKKGEKSDDDAQIQDPFQKKKDAVDTVSIQ